MALIAAHCVTITSTCCYNGYHINLYYCKQLHCSSEFP